MTRNIRITFATGVLLDEAKATLRLAEMAVASLHGQDRVYLEAPVKIDSAARWFEFDVSRRIGRSLALVFAGYVRREFGADAIKVEHVVQLAQAVEAT